MMHALVFIHGVQSVWGLSGSVYQWIHPIHLGFLYDTLVQDTSICILMLGNPIIELLLSLPVKRQIIV